MDNRHVLSEHIIVTSCW